MGDILHHKEVINLPAKKVPNAHIRWACKAPFPNILSDGIVDEWVEIPAEWFN
jgi:hypothetical protein